MNKQIKNPNEYFYNNKEDLEYSIKEIGDFQSLCSFKIDDGQVKVAGTLFKTIEQDLFRRMLELATETCFDDFMEKVKTMPVVGYTKEDIKEVFARLPSMTAYDYKKLNER